jgi:hypothetical protein
MTALQELSLAGCESLTGRGLASLAGMPRLRSLDLRRCVHIDWLCPVASFPALEHLDLRYCLNAGDQAAPWVGRAVGLKDLRLCHTSVTGVGLDGLSQLTALTRLGLGGVVATDAAVARLLRCLPRLAELSLERCCLAGDETAAALSETTGPALQKLDLSYTAVSDVGLAALVAGLPDLQALTLESCDELTDG